ncbi:MAG: hypothetical protein ABI629_22400 [bacterium]
MKTRTHSCRWLIAAAVLFGASVACAADPHSVTPSVPFAGHELSMSRFFSGPVSDIGTFNGKLACLRCDLAHGPDGAAQCQKEGHRHALSMQDGSMIHPLLPGTDEMRNQINSNELHDKTVIVTGRYYPITGAILVSSISLAP